MQIVGPQTGFAETRCRTVALTSPLCRLRSSGVHVDVAKIQHIREDELQKYFCK